MQSSINIDDDYLLEQHINNAISTILNELQDEDDNAEDLLISFGVWFYEHGLFAKAELSYRRVLAICKLKHIDNHKYFLFLSNFGNVLKQLGKYVEAEQYLRQSINIAERSQEIEFFSVQKCLSNLALLLCELGRYSEAEDLLTNALQINCTDELQSALVKNNLSSVLWEAGNYKEVEFLLRDALETYKRLLGDNDSNVAKCLQNLAIFLSKYDHDEESKALFLEALSIMESAGSNPADIADIKYNYAAFLCKLSCINEATKYCFQALQAYYKIYGKTHIKVATALLTYAELKSISGKQASAIFLGKLAINIFQENRREVLLMDKLTLNCFDQKIEVKYHILAEMLIKADRLLEAEHVLGLFKEDEYFDFVCRDISHADLTFSTISYSRNEALLNSDFCSLAESLSSLFSREIYLKNKSRSSDEEKEYKVLQTKIEVVSYDFEQFLDDLNDNFSPEMAKHVEDVTDIMSTLWDLDAETAVIYTLSTKVTFYTILVTRNFKKSFSYAISSDDLSKKVLRFRDLVMKRDQFDVIPLAGELYEIILGQLSHELKDAGIGTLLWMLEGSLRLLPVSALHNGTDYLITSFRNVYLTTKSRDNLLIPSNNNWNALGMGVTQAHEHFKPLPAVKEELEGIVKKESTPGIFPGKILLDSDFTWDAMTKALDGTYQVVHIASHFNLDPCNETMSYLLLGDGSHLTMDRLKSQQSLFRGVDILAFSACSTGVGTASKRGREIDGIGYIGETQGAKTVMATLWPVVDDSTSSLMKEFYRRREMGQIKIEALRQVQLEMLNGSIKPTKPHIARSEKNPLRFEVDREKPYAHPYYWAPYILIGNYR